MSTRFLAQAIHRAVLPLFIGLFTILAQSSGLSSTSALTVSVLFATTAANRQLLSLRYNGLVIFSANGEEEIIVTCTLHKRLSLEIPLTNNEQLRAFQVSKQQTMV